MRKRYEFLALYGIAVVLECAPRQRASRHIAEQAGFSYVGRADGCDVYRLE